ncbi:hypothetical protein [Sporomusa sp.]|uniref:hypothetical protein n=1 Tax=Sporomusa sp. TaxID=2078658 RepID=UPI002B8BBB15|nr:hypothetical protein [Sporomusa sp.]HWR45798.1 hypothetical protein [Sporomusa sp.]
MDEQALKHMLENHIRDQTKISGNCWRITRVETKQYSLLQTCPTCQAEIREQGKANYQSSESAKSAHHRIDGIYKSAGIVATIVSTVIGTIFTVLNFIFKGGH